MSEVAEVAAVVGVAGGGVTGAGRVTGGGWGAVAPAGWPQFMQKRALAGSSAWQLAQRWASDAPQFIQ
jgi:hypothetical protein